MPTQVTNYQCPACTGPLHFSAETGKLTCEYCGSAYDVAEIEALYAQKEAEAAAAKEAADAKADAAKADAADGGWDTSGLSSDWGADADGLRVYGCPSCGAELICDETTAATSCPYCGNPTVVPGQFSGALKPEFVLPFRMTKDDAVRALRAHYRGKPSLPRSFTAGNHIEEIQGVYVPFWLYDATADARGAYEGEVTESHREGDYIVTNTQHYNVARAGEADFIKVPVDGSSKMPDAHMDAIEPFDYSAIQPFSTAYLPGFLADRYDEDEEKCLPRATRRMENTTRAALRETIDGYSEVHTKAENINIDIRKAHYALLPVWMLHTRWNDKDFLFAMNGQTGKLIGDLPVDPKRVAAWFAGISLPLMVILALFLYG